MTSQRSQGKTESESPLAAVLVARIRDGGPIPFAEFMRECLYHPAYGYYSRVGVARFGDYYTSVDAHPIFGRLIARQLAEMWELLGKPTQFVIGEVGAGVGRLAAHILNFVAREFPLFYEALSYTAVERSQARREEPAARPEVHASAGHFFRAEKLPQSIPCGCIFSNELLDAFPTHRVVMSRGDLREIFVDAEELSCGHRFVEVLREPSTPELKEYFHVQGITLPEGRHAEACLDACRWIEDAAKVLDRGFVMTIDYGHEARALYNEGHNRGTLLAYRDHKVTENVLDIPGLQDLTSHVNFTAVDMWGRGVGLERTGLVTQSQFLVALGRANEFDDLYEPEQTEIEKLHARLLLKNLIHPEGLGEKFQVLIQHKGIVRAQLTGLSGY